MFNSFKIPEPIVNKSDLRTKQEIHAWFEQLINEQDETYLWNYHTLDFAEFTEEEKVTLIMRLLDQNWPHMHEDLVRELQDLCNLRPVDLLYKTAFRTDLDYCDMDPLARKCIWALADIGTPAAKEKLEQMSRSEQ